MYTEAVRLVGFFGGSFDPPHNGHLMLGKSVTDEYPDLELLLVPSAVHPFGKNMAPFEHRLEMCRILSHEIGHTEVSDIEARLEGDGRTIDTVRELKSRNSSWELRLVIGQDVYAERDLWYMFDEVSALAPPIVVGRENAPEVDVKMLDTIPDISSTEVRHRLKMGISVEDIVPLSIARYIYENNLYGE